MYEHKKALSHLSRRDPILRTVIKLAQLQELKASKNYFQSLARAIVGQQLSTKAAATIWQRFLDLFGGKMPSAEQILKINASKMRKAGLSFQKISYIKNLSLAVNSGDLNFKKLIKSEDEQVVEALIKIKGVGRWTAEMFLMFSMGRPNVFSLGDLGLRNGVKKLYNIDAVKQAKKMQKLLDLWHPYKTFASRHVWASLKM
jgi:DNA-3-methyladenine glycosylase II